MRVRRRGVSTVVAELMMLAVTVALGAFVYVYSSAAFGNFSSGFSNLVSSAGDALSERIVVEQIMFNSSRPGVDIYMRNVGQFPATVTAVYVQDVTTTSPITAVQLKPTVRLIAGSFSKISITFSFTHGDTYAITIATSRGNTVVADGKA